MGDKMSNNGWVGDKMSNSRWVGRSVGKSMFQREVEDVCYCVLVNTKEKLEKGKIELS